MANKRYPVNDKIINVLNIEKEQEDLLNQMEDNKSIHFYDIMKDSKINNEVKEIHKNSKNKETFNEKDLFMLILIILTISSLYKICRVTDDKNKNNIDNKNNNIIDIDDTEKFDTNENCENNKFSLNHLDDLINAGENYKGLLYLQKFLEGIGTGTSRSVFQYGDNLVIKYDRNSRNYEHSENSVELERFSKLRSPILPIIYKNGKNNVYLVCEKVEKIQKGDFQKILHIPFGDDKIDFIGNSGEFKSNYPEGATVQKFICFIEDLNSSQRPKEKNFGLNPIWGDTSLLKFLDDRCKILDSISDADKKLFDNLAKNHSRFKELARYIEHVISDYNNDFCDLVLKNFGVSMRDGKPYIGILDSGGGRKF